MTTPSLLRQKNHPRTSTSAADPRFPDEAYTAAIDAVNDTIDNFVVTAPDGTRKSLGQITEAHLQQPGGYAGDEDEIRYNCYMKEIIDSAVLPLLLKGRDDSIYLGNLAGYLGLQSSEKGDFPELDPLVFEIQTAAKTAFDKAMAEDRAKSAGRQA